MAVYFCREIAIGILSQKLSYFEVPENIIAIVYIIISISLR